MAPPIWMVSVIWWLGAVVAVLLLLTAIGALAWMAWERWVKQFSDYRLGLWVYQAMRAYERAGHRRPRQGITKDERHKMEQAARALVSMAENCGYVVTIETRPKSLLPLAMGNYDMHWHVRPARNRKEQPHD